jgi:hypothetical protein
MALEQTFNVDPHAAAPTLEQQAAALDKAAAEKAAATPDANGRPDWLPEQFKSIDDYVKSATDTRAELTRAQQKLAELEKGKQSPAEPPKTEGAEVPPQTEADKAAAEAVKAAGLDVSKFSSEFSSTGDVSEESRAALAESLKGTLGENARALVDQYIEGSKATAANARNAAFTEAGGEEAYGKMIEWAKTGLTADQIKAYNKAVEGSDADINSRLLAIRGLRASYEKVNGRDPSLVKGANASPSADIQPFASAHEQTQAINDPRYKKDPDYRAKVLQRILASSL